MWPGPEPSASRSRADPGAGWYVPPVLLLLAAVAGFAAAFAFLADDSRVAHGPRASGDPAAGVRVRLAEGHAYFLYVRSGEAAPFGCRVRAGGRVRPVALTRRDAWNAPEHASFRYTATFVSPVTGTATLRCGGTDGTLLVEPDGTACTYLGWSALGAVGLGAAAAVVLVRRAMARRRAAAARRRRGSGHETPRGARARNRADVDHLDGAGRRQEPPHARRTPGGG